MRDPFEGAKERVGQDFNAEEDGHRAAALCRDETDDELATAAAIATQKKQSGRRTGVPLLSSVFHLQANYNSAALPIYLLSLSQALFLASITHSLSQALSF